MPEHAGSIAPVRDPPSVSYQTQSSRWPPPTFLHNRPARKQVQEFTKRGVEEMMGNYNIWYGKYESQEGRRAYARGIGEVAETRCVTATDVGRTRGSANPSAFICYLFAQGRCHNIPDEQFDAKSDTAKDCFGRERHTTDSDNMGGVGNMMRDSKTLYIGRIVVKASETGDQLEERVRTHFGEFGELDSCKAFPKRCIAFVQFRFRSGAEFAKIAMADQDLGNGDVINVRWATDDPNPKHIELTKRKTADKIKDALEQHGYGTAAENFEYPIDYQVPSKRVKVNGENEDSNHLSSEKHAYPDTGAQYDAISTPAVKAVDDLFTQLKEQAEDEAGNNNWLRDTAWAAVREAEATSATSSATAGTADVYQSVPLPTGWEAGLSPEGYTYYYNSSLAITQWSRPS